MIKLPDTISEDIFLKGIKKVKKNNIKIGLMLGFYQCMRVSEVVKITPEDVDKARGFLYIRQGKGGKDRHVPIMKPVSVGLKYLPVGVGIRALQLWVNKLWPGYHFHSLRHSGATFYLNTKKVDIRFIQQLLGHANLSTTQIYTHVNPDNLKTTFDEVW